MSACGPNIIVTARLTVRGVSYDREDLGLQEGNKRSDALSAQHEEPFIFRAIKGDAATHEVGVCIFDCIRHQAHFDDVEDGKATIAKVFMQKLASTLFGDELETLA